jgi:hypothetical protein
MPRAHLAFLLTAVTAVWNTAPARADDLTKEENKTLAYALISFDDSQLRISSIEESRKDEGAGFVTQKLDKKFSNPGVGYYVYKGLGIHSGRHYFKDKLIRADAITVLHTGEMLNVIKKKFGDPTKGTKYGWMNSAFVDYDADLVERYYWPLRQPVKLSGKEETIPIMLEFIVCKDRKDGNLLYFTSIIDCDRCDLLRKVIGD